ncbi:hypothetical protein [Deinococcus aquaedulcis]|uniref:hypothetical protein n=1 Tax=Deinococcus aquaedulcis TaxID=2840455 RepID=UPI001C836751|nr:hypothetical protein [Deinococcus aquaedulcis]
MLSEEDRRRIEAEELAALQVGEAAQQRAQRRLAEAAYRREVRAALRPRPVWWPLRWALPFVPVVALAVWLALRPATPLPGTDVAGGISAAGLLTRCRAPLAAALGQVPEALHLPTATEAATQMAASPDGRTWNGRVPGPGGAPVDLVCTYTAADDSVSVTVLEEP